MSSRTAFSKLASVKVVRDIVLMLFGLFSDQSSDLFPQVGNVVGDGIPEYVVVDSEVGVNECVAVSCDHFPGDFGMFFAVGFGDMFACFADDLEGTDEGIFAGKILVVFFRVIVVRYWVMKVVS